MSEAPHLCHVFATFVPGGPQVRTCRIANALGDRYRHTFMAADGRTEAADLLDSRLDFDIVPVRSGRSGRFSSFHLGGQLMRLRPALLLTYNWGSMDAVIAANVRRIAPLIHAEDGFGPDEAVRQKRRRVLARRILLRRARAVVAPSLQLVGTMRDIWRLSEEKIRHIPNGIDCERFSPGREEHLRSALGIPAEACVVGTVAHLRREKNLGRLIEAVASLADPTVHLLVVGDGPERPVLYARATTLGMSARVHFLGRQDDPRDCYRTMNLFALSSATEQMPIALLEAMAVGLPVVSTDVGDVKEMLAEENRRHVAPLPDQGAYVRALRLLTSDPGLRRDLGHHNREKCLRDYDEGRMIETYRRLYESAIS